MKRSNGVDAVELSEAVAAVIDEKVADGDLSKEDVDAIVSAAQHEAGVALTHDQRKRIMTETRVRLAVAQAEQRVPLALRIFGGLLIVVAAAGILTIVLAAISIVGIVQDGGFEETRTMTTLIVESVLAGVTVATTITQLVLGIRLVRNRRRGAGQAVVVLILLSIVAIVATVMTSGMGTELIAPGVSFAFLVVLLTYLDPSLARERTLRRKLMIADDQVRAEGGMLGLDVSERGYITLDFFNLFWIFMIGCILGDLGEVVWHATVVDPGVIQNRTGMLFGPFSPIYGIGGVLMTAALNRYHKSPIIVTFLVSALIGGAFEYFVSWFLQNAFGVVAWDYSGTFLNINGRTNLFFMCMWGVAGTVWVKGLLPFVLKIINLIPWKLRYAVTAVCAAAMILNGVMTLQALDCWYERVSGNEPSSGIEQFYADNFGDEWMQGHFESMTITPGGGH